jgi:RNA polymerase sigma-70 factor, ECF subfamily
MAGAPTSGPPPATGGPTLGAYVEARRAVEVVVRAHAGKVVAGLIRYFGDFALAEEVFQDAVAVALERWPLDGVPANPAGWIVMTARRRALDRVRRRATFRVKAQEVALLERLERDAGGPEVDDRDIPDERLALIFTCCHPALSPQAQVALTLRTLGGLSTAEIARGFLAPEPTIAQRIVRAKGKIGQAGIPFRVPERTELPERLGAVLAVVYLVFNEGYATTRGPLVRGDLCAEAIRLGRVLWELMPDEPEVGGLVALMLLQDSRRDARTDASGALVTLEAQDRGLWDRARIDDGTALVREVLSRRRAGPYQLQAAIAAVHSEAATPNDTDWWQIVGLYTALAELHPTPVVLLNRAAAVAMAAGPEVGLRLMAADEVAGPLDGYHLLHAARADLHRRLGQAEEAAACYRRALALVSNEVERSYLEGRLAEVCGA